MLSEIETSLTGRFISIAIIWVGDNLATSRFVEMKKKYAESISIKIITFHFENNDSEDKITDKIKELSGNKDINGIIVELPLPKNFDRNKILNSIPKERDVDVLSLSAQESFYNNKTGLLPPSVEALRALFKECGIDTKGKIAAVFGQSILIGKPISHWLEQAGAKIFRIDENTPNPKEISRQADIIISGVGKPNLIREDMVKNGAVVVDFGFSARGGSAFGGENKEMDKVAGDVDFNSVAPKSSLITPVPGGMGPIVIVAFLKNAVKLAQDPLAGMEKQ